MVCDRCKMAVEAELKKLGLNPLTVKLGEIDLLEEKVDEQTLAHLSESLLAIGFALLTDPKDQLVAKIKSIIVSLVHYSTEPINTNLSLFLGEQLKMPYATLSSIFSERTPLTIEKYFIEQKIEKAKELIAYGEMSLSEIAFSLNYSSVAHLSMQFKKITGLTPSAYKLTNGVGRRTIDRV